MRQECTHIRTCVQGAEPPPSAEQKEDGPESPGVGADGTDRAAIPTRPPSRRADQLHPNAGSPDLPGRTARRPGMNLSSRAKSGDRTNGGLLPSPEPRPIPACVPTPQADPALAEGGEERLHRCLCVCWGGGGRNGRIWEKDTVPEPRVPSRQEGEAALPCARVLTTPWRSPSLLRRRRSLTRSVGSSRVESRLPRPLEDVTARWSNPVHHLKQLNGWNCPLFEWLGRPNSISCSRKNPQEKVTRQAGQKRTGPENGLNQNPL
eukprot:gene17608-biopygen2959